MFNIKLHDVRCFADPEAVHIAPLTILVGENSTGKTSFLALIRIILEMVTRTTDVNFNKDPFFLGAYDQIAHYRGGRGGRAQCFEICIDIDVILPHKNKESDRLTNIKTTIIFVKGGSQPVIKRININAGKYAVDITLDPVPVFKIKSPSWSGSIPKYFFRYDQIDIGSKNINIRYYFSLLRNITRYPFLIEKAKKQNIHLSSEDGDYFNHISRKLFGSIRLDPFAIAPVRTKPERTYDPVEESPKSEGSHVPMLLAKTRFSDKKKWEALKKGLDAFGKTSGLFQEISLKSLGRSDSDPFQIMIKIFGPRTNIMDVGYGVSQILPIITDVLLSDFPRFYLLQQPEVHLHPRAQAEFGTFLASAVKNTRNRFMIETHSDYIIDRIRMDIRDNRGLKPKDVSILFFERQGREVNIHQIKIDKMGNLGDVPKTYRDFFAKEETRFLGIDNVSDY